MSIWHSPHSLEEANAINVGFLPGHLGVEFTEIGDDFLKGRMPVDVRTRQPAGILHGGASCVLAETLGSWAAVLAVDKSKYHCVGLEINANHVRAATSGYVHGVARPLHLGRTTHVWDIRITNDAGKLVCVSRMTMAILEGATNL